MNQNKLISYFLKKNVIIYYIILLYIGEAPCTIDSMNMTLQGTTHTYLRYTARFAALSMVPW